MHMLVWQTSGPVEVTRKLFNPAYHTVLAGIRQFAYSQTSFKVGHSQTIEIRVLPFKVLSKQILYLRSTNLPKIFDNDITDDDPSLGWNV